MPSKTIKESDIRDYLATHLQMIEPGLTLVKAEFYLPNPQGARGFLDIFARDAEGKLVIIEIKLTDAVAREALQELYKYSALLRDRFLVRDTEFRLILLSVAWHELATPYAEFAASAPFDISAGTIILADDGIPVRIEPVKPIALTTERRIATRHFLWGFPDADTATAAVPIIAARVERFGIKDFVLVQSSATNPDLGGRSFLYFAQRELRFEEYLALIEANFTKEQFEEFHENIADLTELEDRVAEASDAVWSYPGAPYAEIGADSAEIAGPEKAGRWFNEGPGEDRVVHRFGRFNDPWLSDEKIVEELRGEGGESDYRLRFSAMTNSPPQMAALRKRVENIFFFNDAWQGAVQQLIRYAERKGESAKVELIAYSNEDILRAIAASAFGFPGYVPMFRLEIERKGDVERFIGLPEWDGTPFDYTKVMAEHFGSDGGTYLLACHFGENRTMNRDIMTDLGMRYSVFRETEGGPERVRVQGTSIVPVKGDIRSINHMIDAHTNEVHKLVEMFMTMDGGFAQTIEAFVNNDVMVAERRLAETLANEPPPGKELYWWGVIDNCDLCKTSFGPLRFMIDASLTIGGAGNVCARCFFDAGRGIGEGRGQVYYRSAKGWRKIAG